MKWSLPLALLLIVMPALVDAQDKTTEVIPELEVITDREMLGNYPLRPIFRWTEVANAIQYQLRLDGRIIYAGSNTQFRPGYDLDDGVEFEAWVVAIIRE
jgi:hypothetical protein